MKQLFNRIMALCLVLLLCVSMLPMAAFAAETNGICGDNLTWSLSNGRLTITGFGDMTDYNQVNMPPWYEFRQEIFYLTLPDGLTSVGNMAFYDCYNLAAVTLPATVKDVGKLAFCQCRNVVILNLNSGLKSIGRSAFEQCEKLQNLHLPDSLTELGSQAFSLCLGLTAVKIPTSVTEMASGVFSYCKNLVRAEIAAPLETVPSWCFYGCERLSSVILTAQTTGTESNAFGGCDSLNTVYYPGGEESAQQLQDEIAEDAEAFRYFGVVTDEQPKDDAVTGSVVTDENGNTTVATTTVIQTESANVSSTGSTTTDTNQQKSASVDIEITILSEEGWQLLMEYVRAAQDQLREQSYAGVENGGVDVNVYLPDNSGVPTDVLNSIAGGNVELTVQNENGAKYIVYGSALDHTEEQGSVEFSYTALRMDRPDFEQLNGVATYSLQFTASSAVRVEVMIRLSQEFARDTATLYRVDDNKLTRLQSVVVDSAGYAHFYLADIDATENYRIGINTPDIDQNGVIIPDELQTDHGVNYHIVDMSKYVVTGRPSSWGVSMNQVMWIMLAVMGGCIVTVGVVMLILNKRKLKKVV